MNILVTGAAGFIGSHLAERLLQSGHRVRALDALTHTYSAALKTLTLRQLQSRGATVFKIDLAADDLHDALDGVDIAFHLAGQPGISASLPFDVFARNNILATARLLDALHRNAGLKGFINVSTSSVYGVDATGDESTATAPTSSYGVTKLAAEQLVLARAREGSLTACSLRLYSVYGPRERPEKLYTRLIASLLEDREFPLFVGSLEHQRSFTYVADVVEGMIAAMNHIDACNGEIFNLGAETSITTREAIHAAETLIGRQARMVIQPKRPGEQWRTQANIAKARQRLGYAPRHTLREGLAAQIAWYRTEILGKIQLW